MRGGEIMDQPEKECEEANERIIEEIIALQREFYFENKNKDSERRRKIRDVIDRATPLKGQ